MAVRSIFTPEFWIVFLLSWYRPIFSSRCWYCTFCRHVMLLYCLTYLNIETNYSINMGTIPATSARWFSISTFIILFVPSSPSYQTWTTDNGSVGGCKWSMAQNNTFALDTQSKNWTLIPKFHLWNGTLDINVCPVTFWPSNIVCLLSEQYLYMIFLLRRRTTKDELLFLREWMQHPFWYL